MGVFCAVIFNQDQICVLLCDEKCLSDVHLLTVF